MTIKKGWIIYNGNLPHKKFIYHVNWLNRVAKEKGLSTKIIKNNELIPIIKDGKAMIMGKYANERPDFVLFWDKDILLAKHLEKMGFKLFNSAKSIEICDNKCLTHQILANNNIPMPKTVIAPMIYTGLDIIDYSNYEYIIEEIGFPMIIKEAYGSFGAQVYLVSNKEEMIDKIKELRWKPFIFQEFIRSSYGRDLRINIVGDKYAASMIRKSKNDFRANISAGGKMYKYRPSKEEIQLAIEAANIIGADFAGVDLLFDENGKPIVCEVNSNAHMKNIYDCTGIDVAKLIIDHIKVCIGV